jgi:hypothetical protein
MSRVRMVLAMIFLGYVTSLMSFSDDAKKNDKLPDFLIPLAEADKVTLYSIDGTDKRGVKNPPKPTEEFQGHPILGKLELKDANTRKEVVQALLKGTQNNTHGFARCFWPRHAFRAEKANKVTDYVICFQCNWIKVFVDKDVKDIVTNKEPQETLNRLLKQANIPIVP